MIPLLQTKTADTAHTGIFASNTRPLSRFLGGAWGRGYSFGSLAGWGCGHTKLEHRACVYLMIASSLLLASFPGLPRFRSSVSVCVQYNTRKRKSVKNVFRALPLPCIILRKSAKNVFRALPLPCIILRKSAKNVFRALPLPCIILRKSAKNVFRALPLPCIILRKSAKKRFSRSSASRVLY